MACEIRGDSNRWTISFLGHLFQFPNKLYLAYICRVARCERTCPDLAQNESSRCHYFLDHALKLPVTSNTISGYSSAKLVHPVRLSHV